MNKCIKSSIFVSGALLFASFSVSAQQGQTADVLIGDKETEETSTAAGVLDELDGWEKTQFNRMQAELKYVSKALGIDSLSVTPKMETAIREFDKSARENHHDQYLFCLPKPLRDAMWAELRESVDKDLSEKLESHITEAELFVETCRKEAIECLVVFLDNHLFLSEEQFTKLESALLPDWTDHNNFAVFLFTFRSLRTKAILDDIDRDRIREFLTDEQQKNFDQIEKLAADPHVILTRAKETESFDFSEAQASLNLSMNSLGHELSNHCEIDEKQLRILNVVRNGAAKSIREKWQAAKDLNSTENEKLYTTPIITQLTQQPIVKKTARKMLGEGFEAYEAERIRRQQIRTRCLTNYLLFYYFNNSAQLRVPRAKLDQISNTICEKLNQQDYVDFQDVSKAIRKDSNEIFEAHLDQEDWQILRARLR